MSKNVIVGIMEALRETVPPKIMTELGQAIEKWAEEYDREWELGNNMPDRDSDEPYTDADARNDARHIVRAGLYAFQNDNRVGMKIATHIWPDEDPGHPDSITQQTLLHPLVQMHVGKEFDYAVLAIFPTVPMFHDLRLPIKQDGWSASVQVAL